MWHLSAFHIVPRTETTARPVLVVRSADKRAQRPRRGEVLLLYLQQRGTAPLAGEAAYALLNRASEHYFRRPGSVTRAIRAVAEELNAYFVGRNRNLAAQGAHTVGLLAVAVWRQGQVYLGLCGPWHAFRVDGAPQHVHDPELAGRGLGVSRALRVRFARWNALPQGLLLLTLDDLPLQEQVLRPDPAGRADVFLSRLMAVAPEGFTALLVQMHPGEGEHRRVQVRPNPKGRSTTPKQPSAPLEGGAGAGPIAPPSPEIPATPQVPTEPVTDEEPSVTERSAQTAPASDEGTSSVMRPPTRRVVRRPPSHLVARTETKADKAAVSSTPSPKTEVPPPSSRTYPQSVWRQGLRRAVGRFLRVGGRWREGLRAGATRLLAWSRRLFPTDEWFTLPRSVMAFTALAVPVLVVAVSLVVYMRRGRAQQFVQYLAQAEGYAQQARSMEDPVARHNALTQALYYLSLAEMYGNSQAAQTLHQEVQGALDQMDAVVRLDFRPLVNGHPLRKVTVARLGFRRGEMYVLAKNLGKVLRLQLQAGGGYDFDPDFQCAPDQFATFTVGPLVDFVVIPEPTAPFAVVAVDQQGHLLFCAPGTRAEARAIALSSPLPDTGRVLRYDGGRLYLLHGPGRALQVLLGEMFTEPPYNFFTGEAPADLDQVRDFAVQRGDVYLLYNDGQLVRCLQPSPEAAPSCEALTYRDGRPGRGDGPTIPEARFVQVELGGPPDPSLFLLDTAQGGVYRFSLQLRLVEQYRPQEALQGPVTAFALETDPASGQQVLYLAAGGQVYGAVVP